MIIGGIAVIARGVRRFTGDIDAAIRGDEIDVKTLITALAKKQIVPRIGHAEQFARESLVLLLRHEPSGVQFDVSFVWTDFEQEAIAAASIVSFGAVKAPMAQPEDLIVFKAIAGRGKDIDDATALLSLYPEIDLARLRARVHQLAALAETPDLGAGLETAIVAAAEARRAAPGAATGPKLTPTQRVRTSRATRGRTPARPRTPTKPRAPTKLAPKGSKK
jgi:hypothetical protein